MIIDDFRKAGARRCAPTGCGVDCNFWGLILGGVERVLGPQIAEFGLLEPIMLGL